MAKNKCVERGFLVFGFKRQWGGGEAHVLDPIPFIYVRYFYFLVSRSRQCFAKNAD